MPPRLDADVCMLRSECENMGLTVSADAMLEQESQQCLRPAPSMVGMAQEGSCCMRLVRDGHARMAVQAEAGVPRTHLSSATPGKAAEPLPDAALARAAMLASDSGRGSAAMAASNGCARKIG